MKAMLFLILIIFSIRGMSQVSTQISFDKKNKTLTLIVKNETDTLYYLVPHIMEDPPPMRMMSYFVFKYKNKANQVVYSRKRLLSEDIPISESRKKQLLLGYCENEYKYYLSDWYKGEVYSVDVYVQIVATPVKNIGKQFKKEIRRSYLWK